MTDRRQLAAIRLALPRGETRVLLTSDKQIAALVKKGALSEQETSVRLNCPVIKIGKG
jgi:hypothetical protein